MASAAPAVVSGFHDAESVILFVNLGHLSAGLLRSAYDGASVPEMNAAFEQLEQLARVRIPPVPSSAARSRRKDSAREDDDSENLQEDLFCEIVFDFELFHFCCRGGQAALHHRPAHVHDARVAHHRHRAFTGREPVEVRVLKPDNFANFVQQQSNLRRAYTATSTIVNPGRYLARGLNKVHAPGTFLLRTLAPELRRALSGEIPVEPVPSRKLSRLAEGPEKLVALPPGLSLVRNQWLNLDLGGADQDFVVPGFDEWTSHGGYQERQVALQPLPAGVYVLQLVQGKIEGQVTLVVTDMSVQAKQTDGHVLVRVAQAQKPLSGAKVAVFGGASGTTDDKGEALLETTAQKALVVVEHGDDRAIVDTDFYSTLSATPDVFIYSDRPIYRPGDSIAFRGIVRQPGSFLAQLLGMKTRTLDVALVGQSGAKKAPPGEKEVEPAAIGKVNVVVDDYGCFNGTLAVPSDADAGVVRLVAQVQGHDQQAEARVQAYVKPTFFLEVTSDGDGITPGTQLKAKVRARRYARVVFRKTWRTKCGSSIACSSTRRRGSMTLEARRTRQCRDLRKSFDNRRHAFYSQAHLFFDTLTRDSLPRGSLEERGQARRTGRRRDHDRRARAPARRRQAQLPLRAHGEGARSAEV